MKAQQAAQAISNANIDLTIRKPRDFKPRKGYKLVHLVYSSDLTPTADSDHRVLGRGYFWTEKGIKELCFVIEVPEYEATPLNRMFENEKAEYRRAHRCKIWNKKHTKKIMCPFSNTCSKCTIPLEERFPSEAEEHQELSFDEVNDEKVSLAPEAHGSAESIFCGVQEQEMMEAIKSQEKQIFFKLISLNRQGFELNEIMEKLDLVMEDVERLGHKLEKYIENYIG